VTCFVGQDAEPRPSRVDIEPERIADVIERKDAFIGIFENPFSRFEIELLLSRRTIVMRILKNVDYIDQDGQEQPLFAAKTVRACILVELNGQDQIALSKRIGPNANGAGHRAAF